MTSNCGFCGGNLTERGPQSVPVCEDCGRLDTAEEESEEVAAAEQPTNSDSSQREPIGWVETVDVKDSSDELLVELLSSLDQAGDDLAANPDERVYAAELATDAWENRLTAGRSVEATVGTCLYIAFRVCDKPRPIGVVADIVDTTTSEITSLRQNIVSDQDVTLAAPQPSNYVPYLSADLQLPTTVSDRAQDMLDGVRLAGDPAGIAAGALYLTAQDSDNPVTMKEAAQATRLTKETIWQRVDDLRNQ